MYTYFKFFMLIQFCVLHSAQLSFSEYLHTFNLWHIAVTNMLFNLLAPEFYI
jgi:hypothetical protein